MAPLLLEPVRKEGRNNLDGITFSFSSEDDVATIILPLLHLVS